MQELPVKFSSFDAALLRSQLRDFAIDSLLDNTGALSRYLQFYRLPAPSESLSLAMGYLRVEQDGIAVAYWRQKPALGTAVVVHGYFDHIGLMANAIQQYLKMGYNVVAFDLQGHGLSGGERAAIDDFDRYNKALQAVLTYFDETSFPLRLVGQSTGGAVIMKQLLQRPIIPNLTNVDLFAPLLYPFGWALVKLKLMLFKWLFKSVPRVYRANSHDRAFLRFVSQEDPLQSTRIPANWMLAMQRWIQQYPYQPHSNFPIHIIQGTQDGTLDWRRNIRAYQEKFPNARTTLIEGAEHHMVNESAPYLDKIWGCLQVPKTKPDSE